MRVRVLGAVGLVGAGGDDVAVGSANQRAVLAALVAHAGSLVDVDRLVDDLWPDGAPRSAVPTLRTYVSRLRHVLGTHVVGRAGGYALELPPEDVDSWAFDLLADRVRDGRAGAEDLRAALALWRGPAFGSEADRPLVRAEATRLEERRTLLRQRLADLVLAEGDAAEAAALAAALTAEEPLREPAWTTLVEALARDGRTGEALRAAHRARQALGEVGLEPSPALLAAERDALEPGHPTPPVTGPPGEPRRAAPAPPAPDRASPTTPPPRRWSTFHGRQAEHDELLALLGRRQVVTLVGPGGVGKTRLAVEVAQHRLDEGLGAVWVDLAAVPPDGSVADALVTALGPLAPLDGALGAVGGLDVLVVLDNAEHVLDQVCGVVTAATAGGDEVRVLVTSRERVACDGEVVRPLPPLATTGPDAPAQALFLDRAHDAGLAGAELDPERVDALVARLDGLPLALEMAAAQLANSSLAELVAAVDTGADALDPLPRGVPERHRSLDALLDWSEQRLAGEDRVLLAELSVFAAAVTADDATAVLGRPVAAGLRRLAAASLVVVEAGDGPARHRLLQTVRDHARRRASEMGITGDLAAAHAGWCRRVVRDEAARLLTVDEGAARARLQELVPEIRAAFGWARTADPDLADELLGPLAPFTRGGMVAEPLRWAEDLVTATDAAACSPGTLAQAAAGALARGELDRASELAQLALADARGADRLPVLDVAGDAHLFGADLAGARAVYEEMRDEAIAAGDELHASLAATGVVLTAAYGDDPRSAELGAALVEVSYANPSARAWASYGAGEAVLDRDPVLALGHFDDAVAVGSSVASTYVVNMALTSSLSLRARHGDVRVAASRFRDVVTSLAAIGDRPHLLTVLRNLVVLLQRTDDAPTTAQLLGFVDAAETASFGAEEQRLAEARRWCESELGASAWTTARLAGARLPAADVAAWVLGVLEALDDG